MLPIVGQFVRHAVDSHPDAVQNAGNFVAKWGSYLYLHQQGEKKESSIAGRAVLCTN